MMKKSKSELRKIFLIKRKKIFIDNGHSLSLSIANIAFSLISKIKFKNVGCYLPINSEVNSNFLITKLLNSNFEICLPLTPIKPATLIFKSWQPDDPLVSGPFGTRQPKKSSKNIVPEILIVPMLAYDSHGFRLGYGGGYYDRTIKELFKKNKNLITIGLAFENQKCKKLPVNTHDVPLNKLVHERGIINFKNN